MIEIFQFDTEIKKIDVKNLELVKDKKLWVDITSITKEEEMLIQHTFDLHPLTSEDLYNSNIRIKVEEFSNYLFCIFYGVQKTKNIDLVELDFILGENFLITNHKKEINSYTELKNNKEKFENLFKKGLDFLFHKLLDTEIDNYFPVLEK